jgi:hypothetical protein
MLLRPLALHHFGQSVDDDIQKAAEQQAQNTRNGGLCPEIHAHQTT